MLYVDNILLCFARTCALGITRYDDARRMMRDLRDGDGAGMEDVDGASRGRPRRRMDSGGRGGGGVSSNVWSSMGAFVRQQCSFTGAVIS